MRPVWFDYPNEVELYKVENEHLLGSDLLVVPVLTEKSVTVEVVIPQGSSFSFLTFSCKILLHLGTGDSWVDPTNGVSLRPGKYIIGAPYEKINVLQVEPTMFL